MGAMVALVAEVVAENNRPKLAQMWPEVKDDAEWAKVRKLADKLGNSGLPLGPAELLAQAAMFTFGAKRKAEITAHQNKVAAAKRREVAPAAAATQRRDVPAPKPPKERAEALTDAVLDDLLGGVSHEEVLSRKARGLYNR